MITTSITSSWRRALLALAAATLLGTSCQRELVLPDVTVPDGQIVFGSEGLDLSVETKATEVTSLSSFYVSAVTGSAGSEASVWNSVTFSQVPGSSPASYAGNKYWPASNPGYKFYGSNVALNFAAGGTYVNASNATDVVCAYLSSPTYNTKNTLSFEHIFARLCRVDVAAQTGYTISNIQMYITPKTGGTYNLRTGAGHTDGTGWSSIATGSATLISNKTGATNNDIYMVPGNYQITCSWVSTDPSGASVTHTDKVTSLPIQGGATNNISVVLGGDIVLGVDLQGYCEYDYRDNLDYLTFYCDEAGTIGWKCSNASIARTIQYSKDFGATWTNLTSTTSGATVAVNAGDIVWFKGSNTEYATSSYNNRFTLSNKAHVYGNVNSLTGNNTSVSELCFYWLFYNCSNLYTYETKKIILPATTLASRCYSSMFQGCTSLTSAPELPAMTLANNCYERMFRNCISLTSAPALPATTLAPNCYQSMFQSCTSLTTAPELSATTLAGICYASMFMDCRSLTTAPELPATTLASSCYQNMFQNCTSLTTAPELPATTLTDYCYYCMFYGCSSLNYIKALFTTDPSSGFYTDDWVSDVATWGVFVKSPDATWDVVGNNGVPTGWTVAKEPKWMPSFGGVNIAPAPLYYNGSTFVIKDDDWDHSSYPPYGKHGTVEGSYFFSYINVGQYFDSRGDSFTYNSGDINNNGNRVSYNGYDDWRMPTRAEWCTIMTGESPGTSRPGSTIDGQFGGAKYALILLSDYSAYTSAYVGFLIFPDDQIISGRQLNDVNTPDDWTYGVTSSELQEYLDQGCVFLPICGFYNDYDLEFDGKSEYCMYLSATCYPEDMDPNDYVYGFYMSHGYINPQSHSVMKHDYYLPVRLVRDAN